VTAGALSPLGERLHAALCARPHHFAELVEAHPAVAWRDFLRAWGEVRDLDVLARDDEGRYLIGGTRA
jgi:hypothetical protein